jgi:ribbon-helix-helix CopG family protein
VNANESGNCCEELASVVHVALDWCILGEPHRVAAMAGTRKSIRTSVILPEEAHARIHALADANHVSAAWVIRAAVLRFLEEHDGQTELPLRLPKARRAVGT